MKPFFAVKSAQPASRFVSRSRFWLGLATWGLLAATAVGQVLGRWYPFELFSHFPVFYATLAVVLLLFWAWQKSAFAWVAAVGFAWNAALLAPWLLAPFPPPVRADFRVLHANVFYENNEYGKILAMVEREQADLCVIHEATPQLYDFLRNRLKQYPYRSFSHAKRYCWILVLSRTPFTRDSAALRDYRAVALRTSIQGREIGLVTVHPRTPLSRDWFESRNRQLRFVFGYTRRQTVPTVLVGDFNVSPWSPVYRELTGKSGLVACRKGFGLKPTWIAPLPIVQLPIDHAFVNGGLRTVSFRTLDLPESDHRPVVTDLSFVGPDQSQNPAGSLRQGR